jgi:hypothetical protein
MIDLHSSQKVFDLPLEVKRLQFAHSVCAQVERCDCKKYDTVLGSSRACCSCRYHLIAFANQQNACD